MNTESTQAAGSTPAPGSTAAGSAAPTATTRRSDKPGFAAGLAQEMKRIASHASKVETLKNGAKLYHLAGGREVEQAPGHTPYVVAKGNWPQKTSPAAAGGASTTPPAGTTTPVTPPSGSGGTTGTGSSSTGSNKKP